MSAGDGSRARDLLRRLAEAESTIAALLSGQIDAVVDPKSQTPLFLAAAQDALRESEERYRRIVETASEGIWTTDASARITFVNRQLGDMLGFPPAEMLGASVFRFVPEASRAAMALRLEHARTGGAEESETAFVRKDGSELWVLLKTAPIKDAFGSYVGTLAMMTDHTRHRRDEQALRTSEEQYRQIVERTTDGIVRCTGDAVILFANRRFAEMLGHAPEELVGVSLFSFMGPAVKRIVVAALERQRRGVYDVFDTTFRHRDGTEIAVSVAGSHFVDAAGAYAGNLCVVRDVTAQKKLQAQLMVSDRMMSVGTLAAGVAHEINNPLAAVVGNLDCIAESLAELVWRDGRLVGKGATEAWLEDEVRAPLDEAREAAQRVSLIVRDLKMFSRAPVDESSGSVDVETILESSLRMAWNEIRHRARLRKDYAPVPRVQANEGRLGQVFLNLLVNAAQALPDGRAEDNEVRLSTRLQDGRVDVEVSDTGAGIPPEIIGQVFDAFFTTKGVGVGMGLGLAICQRIVTDLGGELTVASELGKGSTFRVALPLARAEGVAAAAPAPDAVGGRRGRILVVDDEALVLACVSRILSREHDLVTLVDAKAALALCQRGETFDLVLCDLMMPDMTGVELHRELARFSPAQAERMVFLTGGAFTPQARQFLATLPREHIEKPFAAAALRAIVRRNLGPLFRP